MFDELTTFKQSDAFEKSDEVMNSKEFKDAKSYFVFKKSDAVTIEDFNDIVHKNP